MDYTLNISPEIYTMLSSLLNTGKIVQGDKVLDLSGVQTIRINNGKLRFDPPAKISAKLGPMRVNTTVTEIEARTGGIHVGIDNSPIDIEVQPS